MNLPGGWELVLVVLVIMVLFGYKRLPDATRSIGRSMRIFKAETKGLREDDTTTTTTATSASAPPAPSAQPLPPAPEQPAPSPGSPDEQVQHRQP